MPSRQSCNDTKWVAEDIDMKPKDRSQNGNISLGVITLQMKSKAMRFDEITKGKNVI